MFTALDQPRIGEYLAPGLPVSIDGAYPPAVAAPALGDDTAAVLRRAAGLSPPRRSTGSSESGTVAA